MQKKLIIFFVFCNLSPSKIKLSSDLKEWDNDTFAVTLQYERVLVPMIHNMMASYHFCAT